MNKKLAISFAAAWILCAFGWLIYPGVYIVFREGDHDVVRVNRFTGVREYASDRGWKTQQQLVEDDVRQRLSQYRESAFQGEISHAIWHGDRLTVMDKTGNSEDLYAEPQDKSEIMRAFEGTPVSLRVR
jgi:hypothetical protein